MHSCSRHVRRNVFSHTATRTAPCFKKISPARFRQNCASFVATSRAVCVPANCRPATPHDLWFAILFLAPSVDSMHGGRIGCSVVRFPGFHMAEKGTRGTLYDVWRYDMFFRIVQPYPKRMARHRNNRRFSIHRIRFQFHCYRFLLVNHATIQPVPQPGDNNGTTS